MPSRNAIVCCCLALWYNSPSLAADLTPRAGHRVWEVVTLDVQGPEASEEGEPNPFRDVRMTVTVSYNGADYAVPGYFAADGKAAETGAKSGNVWRAHFVPDRPGEWSYTVAMHGGRNIALNKDSGSALPGDGDGGQFTVADNDGAAGILQYVGSRYLRWSGNGRYNLKAGVDSPENLLGYVDFDGTSSLRAGPRSGEARGGRLHTFEPHVRDWREGDPTWQGGKGKGIIGAVNYLASQGVNSVYFVTLNIAGDGQDVWPWTSPDGRDRFDCSKLDQWETVFAHLDRHGMLLHFVLTETENESLFEVEERSDFADARKLYYRELIARFAHHHAIEWNIGEENGSTPKDAPADAPDRENTDAQRKAFAEYIRRFDNYEHPIVVHTHPGNNWYEKVYPPLLGHWAYEGASLQISGGDVHKITQTWLKRSEAAGRPWFVCLDELGPADTGVKPDVDDATHDDVRKKVLWANLMAGGSGCEWYFGYNFPHNDLNCEDFRSRQEMYRQTRLATEFFQRHVQYAEMAPLDDVVRGAEAWCLAQTGNVYLVYLPRRSEDVQVRLPRHDYEVRWFNPRTGGELQAGSPERVTGGDWTAIGGPPGENAGDWALLLTRIGGALSGTIRVRGAEQQGAARTGNEEADESLIIGDRGGLANVFVYLPQAPEGLTGPVHLGSNTTIDIKDGRFVPHAFNVRTPATVRTWNRDREVYNPRLEGPRNPLVGQIIGAQGLPPLRLLLPEIAPIAMNCDIHPRMRAYVLALDHPFAAVTDRDGTFRIDGLPTGKHAFRVWHERSGWLEKELQVDVEAGREAHVRLEYDIRQVHRD